jgi:hypothetical protein
MNQMNGPDLELRLRDHYGAMDVVSSRDLASRVAEALDRAPGRRWSRFRMPRRTATAAAAGVAVLAVLAVLTAPLWFGRATPVGPAASASATATVAASGSPSSSPSSPLAETPTPTLGPPKCASDPATTYYDVVGWLGTRFVVVADHQGPGCSIDAHQELISVDPAVGQWRTDSQLPYPGVSLVDSTDGTSIAMDNADGILIIDAAGKQHFLPRPDGSGEDFGGYGLPVLPGGGYLVTGGDKLYRVASNGSKMTADPLPAGYVAVAPTSDPDLFILTPAADANVEYGLVGTDFRPYLWNLRTGALKQVASAATAVEKSPNSLAYLSVGTGWLSLAADGSTKAVKRPDGPPGWISPDGSRYVFVPDQYSSAPQTEELRETATGHVLAKVEGVAIGTVVWNGNVAALISGSDLVILDGSTVTRVPLP